MITVYRLILSIFFISLFAFKQAAALLPFADYETAVCIDKENNAGNEQEQSESEKETEVKEKFVEEFLPFHSTITFLPIFHYNPTNNLHWFVKDITLSHPTPPPKQA